MAVPILSARRQHREDTARAARTELIAKAVAAAVPPASKQGKAVNFDQLVRQITTSLSPSVSIVPDEIAAALEAQGMNWQGQFAPGRPLQPFAGYGVQPRGFNYTPGRNVNTQPRNGRIPFATLAQVVDQYDVAQICIQHIINDLLSMPLLFKAQDGVGVDVSGEIERAKAFLSRPDGTRSFRGWLSMWLQDILRFDAGCLYKQRDRAKNVIALKIIEGPTISPLVDYWGDTPTPPAPAFLQFVEGMPWDWLPANDMIYEPFTPLRESPYGVAPIEMVLLNANTDVRFQWYFLQYFTEGTLPATFMEAPPDASDPDALADWQETWDAWLLGDQGKKHQVRWVPAGSNPKPAKDTTFNEAFPEYLMRRTVAAYALNAADLGFVEDVNKANGEVQTDTLFRISTKPRTAYIEGILDAVLQEDLGLRVQVRFDDGREKEDRLNEAQAWAIYIGSGMASPDEGREEVLGLPINPEEMTPRFFADQRLGPVPLSYIISVAGDIDMETGAPLPGSVEPRELVFPGQMAADPRAQQPGGATLEQTPGEKETFEPNSADDSQNDTDATPVLRAVKAATITPAARTALRQWRDNSRTRLKRGQKPRLFTHKDLPAEVVDEFWKQLAPAETRDQVDAVFAKADVPVEGGGVDPKAGRPGPGGAREQDLVEYWAAQIAQQLQSQVDASQVAQEWLGANPPTVSAPGTPVAPGADPLAVTAASFAASLQIDPEPLVGVFRGLYLDSYIAGGKDALDQLAHAGTPAADDALAHVVLGVNWDTWQPGHPHAAHLLANTGLDRLLQQARVTIKEIDDTTRARIATALERGVRAGDTVESIAAEIDKVRDNPSRSHLIAVTETNRAMTRASIDSYRAAGLGQFNLLNSPGACPVCVAIKDANPHPLDDLDAQPPVHPRCRCAAQPVVE